MRELLGGYRDRLPIISIGGYYMEGKTLSDIGRKIEQYRDAGNLTIYAGCANEAVEEVVDLCLAELRAIRQTPVPES